jgi:3-phenylpropionate/cinnamic acid dioxygenase small subunit
MTTGNDPVNFFEQCADEIAIGSDVYNQTLGFYHAEARMLDNLKYMDWVETLTQDIKYNVPIRQTRLVKDNESSIVYSMRHMHEDYRSLMGRALRLSGNSAWAEDPASRTKRFVSNVQVFETATAGEYAALSYLLITRNRFDDDHFDLIPCERRDILRVQDGVLRLAQRDIILDQVLLGTPNLAIFL